MSEATTPQKKRRLPVVPGFSWKPVDQNIGSKKVPCFEVEYIQNNKKHVAIFKDRLPLGQRIAALETFGQPKTDEAGMAMLAAFSLVFLDKAPECEFNNRRAVMQCLDRLDEVGLDAYIRVQLEKAGVRDDEDDEAEDAAPPQGEPDKATVGN
ncbi:hypothetical protein MSKU15_1430 [Komagataeibacter diospyri]|uniref:hypothetical protein n=1 Tax=Komagataeibacter diospyri TaxID=1932662 RepID=UPI00113AEA91|nr:hypothetical protein [Komagataeibacter diospyri]GCE89829.1 hypothetical protein MSKU15_1430 [Komagataeibacter diospyri]